MLNVCMYTAEPVITSGTAETINPRASVRLLPNGGFEHNKGLYRGMSQSEYMLRQRYIENSGYLGSVNKSISVASHPAEPTFASAADVRHFVHEQRKIIANFKAQPWPMQMKMAARKTYLKNLSKYTHDLNTVDTVSDFTVQFLKRMKHKFDNFLEYLTIWGSIIKQIEGNFGSSVASFFKLLRWMCGLNLFLSILVLGFVVIPQSLGGEGLAVPPDVKRNRSAFSFVIDGTGYEFEYSVLFYGYYDGGQSDYYNTTQGGNPRPYIGWGYKLPLAYIMVISSVFFISIICSVLSMAKNYKVLQRANHSEQYMFAWKIFASWDFTIVNKEMVKAKETRMEAEKVWHKGTKWHLYLIRAMTQTMIFVLLVGSCYGVYLTVEDSRSDPSTHTISDALSAGFNGFTLLLKIFQVQLAIIARNLTLPFIFTLADMVEKHHPRTKLKIMLIRLFILYVTSLYVLIIALLTSSNRCNNDINTNNSTSIIEELTTLSVSGRNLRSLPSSTATPINHCCWETTIGQELFKLTITHFLAELFSIGLLDITRWAIVHSDIFPKFNKLVGLAVFDLAENVLKLIYGQSLVWLGVLFCPLLIVISTVKIIILFYVRAIVVSIFNQPPRTMFRIASTKNFYMAILLTVTFLCLFPVGYSMIQIRPSLQCGPFRGLSNMLQIIVNEVKTWPEFLRNSVDLLQSATIIIPGLSLLLIVIFYYMSMVGALKDINKDLRLQLHMEQQEIKERIVREAQAQNVAAGTSFYPSANLKNRNKKLINGMMSNEDNTLPSPTSPGPFPRTQSGTPLPPPQMSSAPRRMSNPFATPPLPAIVLQDHAHSAQQMRTPPSIMNYPGNERRTHVRVREVRDDEEDILMMQMTPVDHTPQFSIATPPPRTGWAPPPESTTHYVENRNGVGYKQTTL